jgi:hypothetical protein
VRFEACFERDFGYGAVLQLQFPGGTFQPQAADVVLQRFADQASENTVKMEARKGGDGRQILQFQLVIQMALNVYERPHDALVVVLLRGRSHWRAGRETWNGNAANVRWPPPARV